MLSHFALLLAFFGPSADSDITYLKSFQDPEVSSDHFIVFPQCAEFSKAGDLYMLDANQSKIFVWNADGTFKTVFGNKGNGPGEIADPHYMSIYEDNLYVLERERRQVTVFDLNGKYKTYLNTATFNGRNFIALHSDLFLFAQKTMGKLNPEDKESKRVYHFQLLTKNGVKPPLKTFENTWLTNGKVNPWPSNVDIQADENGKVFFGCSENSTLFQIDRKTGDIVAEKHLDTPEVKPTDEEQSQFFDTSLTLPGGGKYNFSDNKASQYWWDKAKAHYTHLYLKNGKAALVLTRIGGFNGAGFGFHKASYFVCDMKTGKTLSRGTYELPEDSAVFYRNSRAVAFINTEEGYQIKEVTLKGM